VRQAIETIYRDLDYAKSLIKEREIPAGREVVVEEKDVWTLVSSGED